MTMILGIKIIFIKAIVFIKNNNIDIIYTNFLQSMKKLTIHLKLKGLVLKKMF